MTKKNNSSHPIMASNMGRREFAKVGAKAALAAPAVLLLLNASSKSANAQSAYGFTNFSNQQLTVQSFSSGESQCGDGRPQLRSPRACDRD